jgi:hypothetical protein
MPFRESLNSMPITTPPGNMVVWRGLSRLADILLGVELSKEVVGN